MLTKGPRRGNRVVVSILRIGNDFGGRSASLDVHAPVFVFQMRFSFKASVALIGRHVAAGIVQVAQSVGHAGVRHGSRVMAISRISLQRLSTLACSLLP